MTHDEYASLVSRLESLAVERPRTYKLRVGGLAALGYAYVAFLIVANIALLAFVCWGLTKTELFGAILKATLPILALIGTLVRSLWVTVNPPTGRTITRRQTPALFAQIDELRRAVKAPPPHRVIITSEFNASVSQVPRLGIFGWPRNYLVLGLPLLTAMTVEQYRYVLAHEFAHLSRSHSRFTSWIYRVRGTWAHLIDATRHRRARLGTVLVNRFVGWYGPYLNAYSFALMRAHEFEADRVAAAVVGQTVGRTSLIALSLRGRYQSSVLWPHVNARAIDEPEPPRAAFVGVVQAIKLALPAQAASRWLTTALREDSDLDDPHPSLGARVAALGVQPLTNAAIDAIAEELAEPIDSARTAAAQLLGPLAESIAEQLDAEWRADTSAQWKDRRRHLVRARDGLLELHAQAETRQLSVDEQFQMADWTEDLEGSAAALPLATQLVRDHPDHPGALFMLGRILLGGDDGAGVAHLELAMSLAKSLTAPGTSLIAAHLRRIGQGSAAVEYETRSEAAAQEAAAARAERSGMRRSDSLVPAQLTDEVRENLRSQLDTYPQVGRVWIARKVLVREGQPPYYIMGVTRAEHWWTYVAEGSNNYLARKLADELEFPGGTFVVILTRKRRWLRAALKRVPGSEVYRRATRAAAAAPNAKQARATAATAPD